MERLQRVIGALWLGSAFFLLLVSNAVFRVAPTPTAAGDVVGAMLARWHYVALGAPLVLFFVELRRLRPFILIVLFAAVLCAATQSFVDLRIRSIRLSSAVPISSLGEQSPLRRQFAALHGASMALLLLQGIAAAVFVTARPRRERISSDGWAERSWSAPARYAEAPATPPPFGVPPTEEPLGSTDLPIDEKGTTPPEDVPPSSAERASDVLPDEREEPPPLEGEPREPER